jgi:hypothetical protein
MSTANSSSLDSIFNSKYNEFVANLRDVFPELTPALDTAYSFCIEDRITKFREEVMPVAGNPNRNSAENPGKILPGVELTDVQWSSISSNSQSSIQEFITLLSFSILLDSNSASDFGEGGKEAFDTFLKSMKDKMSNVDFSSFTDKFAKLFGMDGAGIPKLPEKFMKGHIARLAEEMMRDFKPEDFGLDPDTIKECESEPSKAFEMLLKAYTSNPAILQNSIQKIGKRLQAKIQSGAIRPQQIVAEAEELMKEFSENPGFVEMMESFRSVFGMEDPDLARKTGNEQSARMAIVRERLRKKAAANQAAAAAAAAAGGSGGGAGGPSPTPTQAKPKHGGGKKRK